MKLAIIMLLCVLGIGCDPPRGGDIRLVSTQRVVGNTWVSVFHDDRRSVTCWRFNSNLSCLPDSVLR